MKRFAQAAAAFTITVGVLLAAPLSASANDTPTVDYAEFDAAKMGHTVAQVQKNFDSPGNTWYQSSYTIAKEYRQAYGKQGADVNVDFSKVGGVWKVSSKSAYWGWTPNQAHNPSTKSEYLAVKAGMTVSQVRSIIGSAGTRAYDSVNRYGTKRQYVWPASTSRWGDVTIEFTMKNGTLIVSKKSAYWG